MFRPEINRFVDLVHARPERIFCGDRVNGLEPETLQRLIALITSASSEVVLELGSGSGAHLIGQALNAPQQLFIGCELRYKRAFRTIEKAEKAGAPPIYICQIDARKLLHQLPDQCIDRLFVLYPDPWDKTRWLKNRLLSPTHLPEFARVIKTNGTFEYRTDHQEYFNSAVADITAHGSFTTQYCSNNYQAESTDQNPLVVFSEFEQLFMSQKLPLCRAIFSRLP